MSNKDNTLSKTATEDGPITKLLDKIIPRKRYVVNGKEIIKPRSKTLLYVLLVVAVFVFFCYFIPTKGIRFKPEQFPVLIRKMFNPAEGKTRTWEGWFAYLWDLRKTIFKTLKMVFLGTLIGTVFSIPMSVLCARNVVKSPFVYQPLRFIMNFIRTIPTIVLAVIAMFLYGLGTYPGIVSLAVFSFGIMVKMLYEVIETVDMGPYEAVEASGANYIQAVRLALVPQLLPVFLGYFIYTFEINVRGSVVLGYVGAGGIGSELDNAMSNMYYDRVGAVVVALFILVLVIQGLTRYIRGKLL